MKSSRLGLKVLSDRLVVKPPLLRKNVPKKALYFLFLFFVFFPYITFVNIGTDMQPYGFIFAFVIFFLFKKKVTFSEVMLGLVFLSSILFLLVNTIDFAALRSFFNYSSLFFIPYVSYRVLKSQCINFEFFLKFSIVIWFSVSVLQVVLDKSFLTFIVSHVRTTENRGVTGLAPEPTFLGIVFIFFILYLLHTNFKHKKIFIAVCIIGIVFLAKSSMALLFLALLIGLWGLTQFSLKSILITIPSLLFVSLLISEFFKGTRMGYITTQIINEPSNLLRLDESINDRFSHVFFSLKGFFENFLIGHGYNSWEPYVTHQVQLYQNLIVVEWVSLGDRIMSGYGTAFFELGFLALLIPMVLFYLLFKLYSKKLKLFWFHFLFINIIMFSAIPLGFSLFAFYIGLLQYLVWKKNHVYAK